MHICHLNMPIEYYSPTCGGAVATVIMQQTKELIAARHSITILTIQNDEPVYPIGCVIPIRAPQRHELSVAERLISKVKRPIFKWDYAYYGHYQSSFVRALRRLQPAPDVVIVHNDLVAPKHIKRVLPRCQVVVYLHNAQETIQRTLEETIRATGLFVCVSDYIRSWAAIRYGIPADKLVTVHNGVDLDVFRPPPTEPDPRGDLKVLFLGRLNPDKGPDVIADAVSELRREGKRITLSVGGGVWWYDHERYANDPYFQLLRHKMGRADAQYLGHVPRAKVAHTMCEHDVVAVPSRWAEPFGLVPLEAMACGRAVITTRRGGLTEVCGEAAVYVDPEEPSTMIDALKALEANPYELAARKRAAREQAEAFSWRASAAKLMAALDTCPGLLRTSVASA